MNAALQRQLVAANDALAARVTKLEEDLESALRRVAALERAYNERQRFTGGPTLEEITVEIHEATAAADRERKEQHKP